jgi:hypothetical protein
MWYLSQNSRNFLPVNWEPFDDRIRHSKPVDDVGEEGHGLLCPEVCDWACLDPLGEFIHGDQQVGVALGRLSQGPNDVQPPHGKRPCDGNCLQDVSREISLAGIELAPLASVYDLVGISDHSGPIKALVECISHESVRRRVVAAHTCMDVSTELVSVGDGDAPLQDAK